MKNVIFFSIGLLTGFFAYWIANHNTMPNKTLSASKGEVAVGEMFYEELLSYPPDLRIDQITQIMKDLAYKKRSPQKKSARDQILMDLAAAKIEIQADQNLKKAEALLAHVSNKPNAISVVEGKVYIEVFEQGQGEVIKSDDVIYITFKQYDIEGNVLKDTQEKSFPVHLSRMIKGFQLGIKNARVGECRRMTIHPDYGFGKVGRGDHSNQVLIYEVKIKNIHHPSS